MRRRLEEGGDVPQQLGGAPQVDGAAVEAAGQQAVAVAQRLLTHARHRLRAPRQAVELLLGLERGNGPQLLARARASG